MGNKLWIMVLWIVVLCIATPSILRADSSQQLWEKLSAIHSFQAAFVQTTLSSTGNPLQSSTGQLLVGGKAKFKIETYAPYPQTLVSDGQDFWSYDPDLEQVVVSKLSLDINKVPILLFGSQDPSLLDAYHVSVFETDALQHFVLEPRANDSLFEILTLSFKENVPVAISLQDTLAQKTHLQLSKIKINSNLNTEVFDFVIPSGIDVIDER